MSLRLERRRRNLKKLMAKEELRRQRLQDDEGSSSHAMLSTEKKRDLPSTPHTSNRASSSRPPKKPTIPSSAESSISHRLPLHCQESTSKATPQSRRQQPSPSPSYAPGRTSSSLKRSRSRPSPSRTPIDPKWLDPPSQGRGRDSPALAFQPKALKLSQASPLHEEPLDTKSVNSSTKKDSFVKGRIPPTSRTLLSSDEDSEDSFGEDLLAEFRQSLKSTKGSNAPTSHRKAPPARAQQDIIEEFTPSQEDSLEDSEDDDIAFPKQKVLNAESTSANPSEKSTMEDSQDDENDSYGVFTISQALKDKEPEHSIPHNPIALAKQEQKLPCASPANNQNDDSLWADSDNEKDHASTDVTKQGRKRKSVASDQKPRKNAKKSPSSPRDDESLKGNLFGREFQHADADEEDLRRLLHPDLSHPKFGPFALQPLVLENESMRHEVPAALNRYLAPFQQEGVKFIHKCLTSRMGAILGDDMGCGKTIQVLSLLCALFRKTGTELDAKEISDRQRIVRDRIDKKQRQTEKALLQGYLPDASPGASTKSNVRDVGLPEDWWPILIIVPPGLVENWKNEFAQFTHFSVAVYDDRSKREKALNMILEGMAEVLVTTKAVFQQKSSFGELNAIPLNWKLVIIDEFHTWKNVKSIVAEHLRALKQQHHNLVLGMTGTLMSNNHKELWNLIDLVETGYLGAWDEFKTEFADPIKFGRTKTASAQLIERSDSKARALREQLGRMFIERKKEDVLRDHLPQKLEKLVLCEPSPLQKEVYQHILTLPDYELVKKASAPCDCGVNMGFFQRLQRLRTDAEQVAFFRRHKDDIIARYKCCYRVPLNPRKGSDEPEIDPEAVIWRMMMGHGDDKSCKDCPYCCGLPALTKLYKLGDHLALIQAANVPGSDVPGSPEHVDFVKNLEFAKVALPSRVLDQLPGQSYIRHDGIMDDHFALSGKLKVLDRLLQKFSDEGSKVLLFSYSTQTLDLIQNYLRAVGHSFLRMDGTTNKNLRQGLADQFNKDKTKFVFLLSTRAMGTGLNLTSANKVIIFDVEWNPSNDEQAQDRAYRIGQEQDVEVMRLVSQGTIDELKYLRQLYKVQLKQETLTEAAAAQNAPRIFRGVEGDRHRKGELFGYENLLRFKDGCFLHDIWKQTGTRKRNKRSTDMEIHEAAALADELIGMGDDNVDRALDNESGLEALVNAVSRSSASQRDWYNREDGSTGHGNESDREESNSIQAEALDHQDLFRRDRGRAALEEGDEGFEEEMGGGTQNIIAVYEGGFEMPDNPQDGGMELDVESQPARRRTRINRRTVARRRTGTANEGIDVGADLGIAQAIRPQPVAPAQQEAVNHVVPNGAFLAAEEPEWVIGSATRQARGGVDNRAVPQRRNRPGVAAAPLPRIDESQGTDDAKSSAQLSSPEGAEGQESTFDSPNINLFGQPSKSRKKQSTAFSANDLFLPSYKKRSKKS